MSEARITPILIETRYDDDPDIVSSHVHLVRSLGGPIMNIALGGLGLVLLHTIDSEVLVFFTWANLAIGVIVLLPLSTLDGGVIWSEVLKPKRRK